MRYKNAQEVHLCHRLHHHGSGYKFNNNNIILCVFQGRSVGATEPFLRLRKFLFFFLLGGSEPSHASSGHRNTNSLSPLAGTLTSVQVAAAASLRGVSSAPLSLAAPLFRLEIAEPSSFLFVATAAAAAASLSVDWQDLGSSFSVRLCHFPRSL